MASKKVIMIMRSRGAPYSLEELEKMPDRECWSWIYANRPPPKPVLPEICFTGFDNEERKELHEIAKGIGFKNCRSVTKTLRYLCVGDLPGPSKLITATFQDVKIITEKEFRKRAKKGMEAFQDYQGLPPIESRLKALEKFGIQASDIQFPAQGTD